MQDSNNLGDPIVAAIGQSNNNLNWNYNLAPQSTPVILSASPSPSRIVDPVTFTVLVSPSGATRGEVEFYLDSDHIVGCVDQPVTGGNTATCTVTNLALGSQELTLCTVEMRPTWPALLLS